jgi:hypothetical protein
VVVGQRELTAPNRPSWWVIALVIVLSPLIVVLMLFVVMTRAAFSVLLHLIVWVWWLPHGQDVLFVYSDSPVWHDYIEAEILLTDPRRANNDVAIALIHMSKFVYILASGKFDAPLTTPNV